MPEVLLEDAQREKASIETLVDLDCVRRGALEFAVDLLAKISNFSPFQNQKLERILALKDHFLRVGDLDADAFGQAHQSSLCEGPEERQATEDALVRLLQEIAFQFRRQVADKLPVGLKVELLVDRVCLPDVIIYFG